MPRTVRHFERLIQRAFSAIERLPIQRRNSTFSRWLKWTRTVTWEPLCVSSVSVLGGGTIQSVRPRVWRDNA